MKTYNSAGLLAKGYCPLPVPEGEKYPMYMKAWQKRLDWSGSAPGLGLNLRGLAMIDFDIRKPADDATVDWVTKLAEGVAEAPLRYRRNSPSCALLVRVPELEAGTRPHTLLRTAKWVSADVEAFVEVKMGAGHFMFGWGTHPSGEQLIWDLPGAGDAPHPDDFWSFDRLPAMTIEDLANTLLRLEGELAERFAPLEPSRARRSASGWTAKHDLRWDQRFEDANGDLRSLRDIWDEVQADEDGHAWVNLTAFRPDSDSLAGHVVESDVKPGYPAIFDFAYQVAHYFDEESELDDMGAIELPEPLVPLAAVEAAEKVAEEEAQVSAAALAAAAVHRLIYVKSVNQYLFKDDPEEVWMTERGAFHGFTGKERIELAQQVPAVQRTIWDPELPALTTITNTERGWAEHNTYAPPAHTARGGDLEGFFTWLTHFLPDEDERSTVLDWLAHKAQKPWDRMFALVLVGKEGGGKGTLWKAIRRLWGHRSVSEVGSIQAIYDARYHDMLYRALFVLVDEVSSEDAIQKGRKVAHERLKAFCEPQAGHKLLNLKGRSQVAAKVCATVGIATNNVNALPIGARDRRFFVAATGDEMPPNMVRQIHTWLADDANVAALYRYLQLRDLGGFNAMRAPDSAAKEDMHSTNITDVDAAVEEVRVIVEKAGGVCLAKQAYEFFEMQGLEDLDYSRAKKAFRRAFPDRPFQSRMINDGKAFRAFGVDRRLREYDVHQAWASIDNVYTALTRYRESQKIGS